MPTFSYSVSDFTPFTKIRSSDVNSKFTSITTFFNTTKLDDDNLQNAGITRATKLKTGTAKAVITNDTSGAMSELVPVASTAVFFNSSSVPTASQLPLLAGGTGASLSLTVADDVFKVNNAVTAITLGAPPSSRPEKLFRYWNFS